MEISSIYKDLTLYRYAAAGEVDGEGSFSYNRNYAEYSSNQRKDSNDEISKAENKKTTDKLEISDAAKKAQSKEEKNSSSDNNANQKQPSNKQNSTFSATTSTKSSDEKTIEELKKRDSEVRSHESAHIAAGGNLVRGGPTYSYQMGPDGKQYAVGGEVKIDTSSIPDNPDATISKMQQVKSAALAPADPSPQDRSVAQMASSTESKARADLQKKSTENMNSISVENSIPEQPETPQVQANEPSNNNRNTEETNSAENRNQSAPIRISQQDTTKSTKKSEKDISDNINKLIEKINNAPSLDRLQVVSLKIKAEYINKYKLNDSFA
jgi:hypothetical protein